MSLTESSTPPKPPVRRASLAWTLTITGAATFMAALDNLVVTTALPVIREDLGGGLSDLEWIVNGYTLPFACLLLLAAALGDRFGRRRVFGYGVLLFTLASAWAAMAGGTESLIAARAAQGAGAAVLLPLSLTLISAAVPAERRGMAFGIWGAVNGVAIASGPLVGGAITEHLAWQWIFWLNVPIGLALLPLVRLVLSESHGRAARLDLPGTVLASAGLFGVVLGIIRGHEHGWSTIGSYGSLLAGAALVVLFVLWELRTPDPMLPMRFFRSRTFSALNAASLLMYLGMFGSIFLLIQFLQFVQGYSPLEAGVRVLPWTAMPMVVAPIAGILTDRIGGKPIVGSGMLIMASGLAWFALTVSPDAGYLSQVPAFVLCGIGMAMFFAPTGAMVMGSVEPSEQGIASGVNNSLRELGGALGVALLASVFAARGGYESGDIYVDGLVPALWLGVGALLVATAAMALVPGRAAGVPAVAPAGAGPAGPTGPTDPADPADPELKVPAGV
jgi:EmrB/QacA subfamily drug resistance transporter